MEDKKKIYTCRIKTTIIMEFDNEAINIPDLQAFLTEISSIATKHGFEDIKYGED